MAAFFTVPRRERQLLLRVFVWSLACTTALAVVLAILENPSWIARVYFWYVVIVVAAILVFYLFLAPLGIVLHALIPPIVRVYKDFISFEKPSLLVKVEDINRLIIRTEGGRRILTVESSAAVRAVDLPDEIDIERLKIVFADRVQIVDEV